MSKGRYFTGIAVSVIILIVGIIMSLIDWMGPQGIAISLSGAYVCAALICNLIWFNGPLKSVCVFGFGLIITMWKFYFSLFVSGLCLFIVAMAFSGPIIAFLSAVTISILMLMLVISVVIYPFNIIWYAFHLNKD